MAKTSRLVWNSQRKSVTKLAGRDDFKSIPPHSSAIYVPNGLQELTTYEFTFAHTPMRDHLSALFAEKPLADNMTSDDIPICTQVKRGLYVVAISRTAKTGAAVIDAHVLTLWVGTSDPKLAASAFD
jgi:hypothetical protein